MTSRMKLASAPVALHVGRPTRPPVRRSKAHVQDALQRWTNGPSTRVGEPLITAHAQLECTSEASLTVAWCRCNAPYNAHNAHNAHNARNAPPLLSPGYASMQLSQVHDAWQQPTERSGVAKSV